MAGVFKKVKITFWGLSSLCFLILLSGTYLFFKAVSGCEYCFRFRLLMTGGTITYIDTWFYQYVIVNAIIFGFILSLFIAYYTRQPMAKRISINIFLQLIVLAVGGFFSGALFAIHDMLAGFYPGFNSFIGNIAEYAFTASLFGGYIIFESMPMFGLTLFILTTVLIEVLRYIYVKNEHKWKKI